jgi:hypothetical protein
VIFFILGYKEIKTMRRKKVSESADEFILTMSLKSIGKLTAKNAARSIRDLRKRKAFES